MIVAHCVFLKGFLFSQAPNNTYRNGRLIPQIFTSVPALNGAVSYLAETTSYITSCLPDFSGELDFSKVLHAFHTVFFIGVFMLCMLIGCTV